MNRVDEEHMLLMKSIGETNLKHELKYLEELFEEKKPVLGSSQYYAESNAKRVSEIRAQMGLIKDLCQYISGAVHPKGQNTKEEKDLAAELVLATRKKMQDAGVI